MVDQWGSRKGFGTDLNTCFPLLKDLPWISPAHLFSQRGPGMLCVAPCMFPLHNGRRLRHVFLAHGQILMTSCSSNEVGTTYFYLRWEERCGIHKTVVVGEDEWGITCAHDTCQLGFGGFATYTAIGEYDGKSV